MACVGRWKVWCCAFFVILRVIRTEVIQTNNSDRRARVAPAPEFSRHALVRPRIYSGREKREVSCTRDSDGVGGHVHDLTIGYDVNGKDYILDLRLNRELIPKSYFERYQNNGLHVVNKPTGKEVELCEYQGKLRGVDNSWAAISTCQGLSGVIFDGEELHYLEPGSDAPNEDEGGGYGVDNTHFLYRHSDIQANQTCGYSGTSHHILGNQEFNRILRYKRDAEMIRGPYNANKQSRYVELVLVVDNKEYKQLGENLSAVYLHCKKIANIINSLYVPLNIFIALVGVVVWTENDEISLSNNGDTTLTNFLLYRRQKLVKEHPNDNAQLLTRVQFDGGVVGKALKGPICTYEFSGGVSMDHSSVVGLVATTVAHEMGHNFGMEHDTADCKCPNDRCIMAPSSSSMSPTQWSSCSLEYLALAFVHGMDYCLRNKPTSLFDSPVCGNGFVEVGEQCDCGLKESCDNPCCNATSCMLYSNASCATGECCDLQTCRPKIAGSECRSSDHECDLPEYCTGQSEYCPEDVFKMDGEECDFGKAFCYNGSCRTHSDQCRLLWGSTGASSDVQCYQMNNKGTRHGNCGYNRLNQSFLKCTDENVYCGMLHCKHLNERLEFGMESVAILSHSFINSGGSIIPCRTAIVDLGLNEVDPGLAPDGAKCGDNKMCVKQKCMPVGSLRLGGAVCPQDCNGNGVCNSRGHCHCRKGFAPPLCDYPGVGGSQDSGPASDPNARRDVMTALYVIFLGIVPFVALVALFMYYTRRNLKHWWKKGSRSAPSNTTATDTRGPPLAKPGEKKPPQRRISRGNSLAFCSVRNNLSSNLEISSPIPADARSGLDNAHASLLPKADGSNGLNISVGSSSSESPTSLQNNFFGHFKGFSITRLPSSTESPPAKVPSSPAKVSSPLARAIPNHHPCPVAQPVIPPVTIKTSKLPTVVSKSNSTVANSVKNSANATPTSVAPALPPANASSTARPLISSPILDATTCTARELVAAGAKPSRPAPQIPAFTTIPSNKPPRPISSPNALSVNISALPPPMEDKKNKESGTNYPTLTRLASFMMRQNSASVARSQSQNQGSASDKSGKSKIKPVVEGTNSLPRLHQYGVKANKLQIDRETLRNLQISDPILQQEIDIPESAVPVRPTPPPLEESSKQVVMRAQSLRGSGPVTQRPLIPTFGSMRQASAAKRPTSIPAATRPTSPPPPRPPPPPVLKPSELTTGIIGMPGYQNPPAVSPQDYCYDDCFNLLSDGAAPLANIDEESSPTNGDNIYAVIEESPPEHSRRNMGRGVVSEYTTPIVPDTKSENKKLGSKFDYSSPSFNEYKLPKPIENSVSAGSVESVGLLSEIVNEIQARNMESIYSTSTLGRKNKRENDGISDDDVEPTVLATTSVIGSDTAQLFPDKTSAVASSNSSLGTYVNAPYTTSSIYRPSGSVYSNLSSRNASSHNSKPSISSSSSSSGYISPMTVHATPAPMTGSFPGGKSGKDFSTFRTPLTSCAVIPSANTTTSDSLLNKDNNLTRPSTSVDSISTYKPYSSSLQRSLGPLAATFRIGSPVNKDTKVMTLNSQETESNSKITKENGTKNSIKPGINNAIEKSGNSASISKRTPSPVISPPTRRKDKGSVSPPKTTTNSTLPNKSSLHRTPMPSNLSNKPSSVPIGNSVAKSGSPNTMKTAHIGNASNLHKGKGASSLVRGGPSNSPDVVSSCAIGGSGNADKSPDVLGGKIDSKIEVKSPDLVASSSTKVQPNLPSLRSNSVGINRTQSSFSAGANKGVSVPAGKPGINSSFKGSVTGRQPQPAPKPLLSKPAGIVSGNMQPASALSIMDKKVFEGKEGGNKGVISSAVGRASVLSKSASDAGGNRTMPAAARAAASKLSHVASLQQKFETAASNSDKGSVALRTPSGAAIKTKTILPTVGVKSGVDSGRSVGFKK